VGSWEHHINSSRGKVIICHDHKTILLR